MTLERNETLKSSPPPVIEQKIQSPKIEDKPEQKPEPEDLIKKRVLERFAGMVELETMDDVLPIVEPEPPKQEPTPKKKEEGERKEEPKEETIPLYKMLEDL